MKRKHLIFLVILIFTSSVFAKEYKFFDGTCFDENIFSGGLDKSSYYINYDTSNGLFYFIVDNYFETKAFVLDKDNIAQLRTNIEKYFEWSDLATEKQIKLEKQLPNSDIKTTFIKMTDTSKYSTTRFVLKFVFFSQNENFHQLIMTGPNVVSDQNEWIDLNLESKYFNDYQIESLYEAFSEENMEAKIKEIEEQEMVEELFQ